MGILIAIIVLLTKSSCPYVYVYNGTDFIFEGEIFGGAIGANMERDDYMPLPSAISEMGKYRIKINDELKEHQFIDVAELVVVDHPKGTSVLLDSRGEPQLITEPVEPLSANSFNGADFKAVLAKRDNSVFLFDNEEYSKNGVVLKFTNNGADNGRLLLRGKNTLWFDYIYGEFLSKFGSYYETWTEKQEKLSYAEKMQLTLDSDIPLSVYLKVDGEWQSVDYLMTVGPLAARDFVIPIDLRQADDALIEIKLETGFMFWELDYAGFDLTANSTVRTMTYLPESAIDVNNNRNWTKELSTADNKYMVQTLSDESTDVVFDMGDQVVAGDKVQSVFLHTQGYYTLVRDFEGAPLFTELKRFKTPGHFSDFSKQMYEKRLTDTPNFTQH